MSNGHLSITKSSKIGSGMPLIAAPDALPRSGSGGAPMPVAANYAKNLPLAMCSSSTPTSGKATPNSLIPNSTSSARPARRTSNGKTSTFAPTSNDYREKPLAFLNPLKCTTMSSNSISMLSIQTSITFETRPKKHGGPDLGPTRSKQAWATLGVDGKGIVDSAPAPDFEGMPRLTVRMVARLQGFPDEWLFHGAKTMAYRQVGNAFPAPVACAVGKQIRACLLKKRTATIRKSRELTTAHPSLFSE